MEQTPIRAGADLIDNVGLEIAVDGARNIFALTCFGEESAEPLVWNGSFTLFREITIRL